LPQLAAPSAGSGVTWVSVAAFAVSIVSIVVSVFFGVRQARLQRRLELITVAKRAEEVSDRGSAAVTVGLRNRTLLDVTNGGPAEAPDVTVTLSPVAPGEASLRFPTGDTMRIGRLARDQSYPVTVVPFLGMAPQVDVILTWADETGPRTRTLRLSIPNS
jgi:hypothetical protein